ncbi:MAG: hypothetical protein ACMG6S_27655, partial [Byssovorax sp.]
ELAGLLPERRAAMEDLAERFCREAKERRGLRYSKELQQLAVEYARQSRAQGHPRRRIADRLGLSEWSLSRWLRRDLGPSDRRVRGVHEVKLIEAETASSQPVLVMPSGARVEGLSIGDLVVLLRAVG